jgi:NitT/TauT family transport system ATP-binding protein
MKIGFLPLLDCAPLVAAVECGFAAADGLELELERENNWASVRDRLIVGQYQAAHMLAPMPIATSLGLGPAAVPMIVPFALGHGGNTITVTRGLWSEMQAQGATADGDAARQGQALRDVVRSREAKGQDGLTFAMVYPFSCHNYLLRYWLAASGIDPDRDVRLVVVPPPLMAEALVDGQVDGICVGEPWGSLAVASGAGRIVATTAQVWSRAPEKVLGLRDDWARGHPEALAALIRTLRRAAAWCADAANHEALATLLAAPRWVGAQVDLLRSALGGRLRREATQALYPPERNFWVPTANVPDPRHAAWICAQMARWGQVPATQATAAAQGVYRPDLYFAAFDGTQGGDASVFKAELGTALSGFFDGATFERQRPER